jgi:hypothetical protein
MNRSRVAELLHEAAETHADWLVRLSELPDLLGRPPVRSELTWLLVLLDREPGDLDEPWEDRYARRIVEHFAG